MIKLKTCTKSPLKASPNPAFHDDLQKSPHKYGSQLLHWESPRSLWCNLAWSTASRASLQVFKQLSQYLPGLMLMCGKRSLHQHDMSQSPWNLWIDDGQNISKHGTAGTAYSKSDPLVYSGLQWAEVTSRSMVVWYFKTYWTEGCAPIPLRSRRCPRTAAWRAGWVVYPILGGYQIES